MEPADKLRREEAWAQSSGAGQATLSRGRNRAWCRHILKIQERAPLFHQLSMLLWTAFTVYEQDHQFPVTAGPAHPAGDCFCDGTPQAVPRVEIQDQTALVGLHSEFLLRATLQALRDTNRFCARFKM